MQKPTSKISCQRPFNLPSTGLLIYFDLFLAIPGCGRFQHDSPGETDALIGRISSNKIQFKTPKISEYFTFFAINLVFHVM